MVETIGLGLCGVCEQQIESGTPIWTAVFAGTPKVCHKTCHPNQSPAPQPMVAEPPRVAMSGPATGAAPQQPAWMRPPMPVPPILPPEPRDDKHKARLEAITAALRSSPSHAWTVLPGPTDLAPILASDVLDWLSDNGWQLRRYKRKSPVT